MPRAMLTPGMLNEEEYSPFRSRAPTKPPAKQARRFNILRLVWPAGEIKNSNDTVAKSKLNLQNG